MPSTTNPADWFLPIPFTSGNVAKPLIDGASYFDALKSRIGTLSGSPYLLVSGWRLNPRTSIDPARGESVEDLIRAAAGSGVAIRSMLWLVPGTIGNFAPGHGAENLAFTRLVLDQGGEAILDNRLPKGQFASHHQKFVVTGSDAGHVAFVGGIDLAPDRWDDGRHDGSSLREPELFAGWHDVQLQVEGPAVGEIWDVFQKRWNDPRPAHALPGVGGGPATQLFDRERPAAASAGGTHAVQILKTFACRSDDGDGGQSPYPFAPGGEHSYEQGLVKAIENAEHYVYVEDQYLWPCAVVDALADAAARGVTVILMLARDYDVDAFVPYHLFLRSSALAQLLDAEGRSRRVFVYHLEQTAAASPTEPRAQIYVHAKTVVIDDRYLVVGSANVNRRSMRTDTELGVAVVDTSAVSSTLGGRPASVGALARDYRKQLWTEHLRRPAADDPLDASGAPAGFPTDDRPVGHVRIHEVGRPRFCQPNVLPFGLMNAETTCNG